jgi:DNA-binding transcriptional regulator YiaG
MKPVETTASTTEATVTATPAPAVAKAPSKKSLALAIFAAKMVERTEGLYASNKDFRAAVLRAIETDLGVSTASAATMYNAAKSEAEKADATVVLGRDPKKVKVKSESGKRGRPAGSKNKAKEVTDAVAEVATTEAAPAEAVAA